MRILRISSLFVAVFLKSQISKFGVFLLLKPALFRPFSWFSSSSFVEFVLNIDYLFINFGFFVQTSGFANKCHFPAQICFFFARPCFLSFAVNSTNFFHSLFSSLDYFVRFMSASHSWIFFATPVLNSCRWTLFLLVFSLQDNDIPFPIYGLWRWHIRS
jgi:hypothetical protein